LRIDSDSAAATTLA